MIKESFLDVALAVMIGLIVCALLLHWLDALFPL